MPQPLALRNATTPPEIEEARGLFLEYARSLNFSLCFQGFDAELAGLPGAYAPPRGRLWLADAGGELAGCVALRPLGETTCEMKRLFVRPAFRGRGLSRGIVTRLFDEARAIGYERMRLDTVPAMREAITLYRSLAFREIEPYSESPVEGALFFERAL